MHRRRAGWLQEARAFLADRRGNAAMMLGLALLPLMGATGLAIDTVLAYTAENQLQKSLDAAALAAGRTLEDENVQVDAEAFFAANFGDGSSGADLTDLDVVPSADGGQITLTASATMPTRFMRIFGKDSMTLRARTVIQRQTTGVELSLVLDITGSMLEQNKIGSLKTAANDLLNILYGDRATVPNLWVSIVPYIGAVNIGRSNISFLSSTDRARGSTNPFSPDVWAGCVLARSGNYDRTDDPPSVRSFGSYLYPDTGTAPPSTSTFTPNGTEFFINDWGSNRSPAARTYSRTWTGGALYWDGYGPNVGCPTEITPLAAQKSTLQAAITALRPWYRSGTVISEGLAWGWRTISPRWRDLWAGAPSGMPLAYGTPSMTKAIVLLTDGFNQMPAGERNGTTYYPYNAYAGLPSNLSATSQATAEAALDSRTTTVCNNVKAQGITLYTITFGNAPTANIRNLMRSCATRPELYYHSPDGAALRTAFRRIGSQLSSLRIAE